MSDAETTEDRLLGGRVLLRQLRTGLRAAIDPVLLAAGVPARPGERVLEAGCGAGAAFLCLAARVPGLRIVAVEREPVLAELARTNAAANGLEERVEVIRGDIADPALVERIGPVAHGFANPPWWPGGTPPPDALRRAATHGDGLDLAAWAAFLGAALRPGGSIALLLPTGRLDAGLVALGAADCGDASVMPFWPRAGRPAKRVLLRARRHRAGPLVLAAGMVLHEATEGYSEAAEAVLRDAAPIA